MKKTVLLMCLLCVGALKSEMMGQTAAFKALFLYNFTKNIDWPSSEQSDEIIITVMGDDEIRDELAKIAKIKKVGNKALKVVKARNVKEVGHTHILFLGSSKSAMMKTISHEHQSQPVLLVADKEGWCEQGACISFLTKDGKLRYEISPGIIASHNLKITQKVISLGIEVE